MKKTVRIDAKDMKQMAAIAIPLLLLFTIDYWFEDMFRSLDSTQQFFLFFGLVFATALLYQRVLKKWVR